MIAIGHVRGRGRELTLRGVDAEVESPLGWMVEFRNGKALRAPSYLDPNDALAAGEQSE